MAHDRCQVPVPGTEKVVTMVVKEVTASVHVFRRDPAGGWLTVLVRHPRLGCWLPAGVTSRLERSLLRRPSGR
jgi:hypothetical protein